MLWSQWLLEATVSSAYAKPMEELLRSNDPVMISFVEALMREAGIAYFVADQHMSILEGSVGAIPRRVLVDTEALQQARRIMKDCDLGKELKDPL